MITPLKSSHPAFYCFLHFISAILPAFFTFLFLVILTFRFKCGHEDLTDGLLALILSGQTELWDKLRLSAYRAILERVDIECFLTPMDFSDTKQYIEAQLDYSGHGSPIFTDDAMKSIFEFSGGYPRLINRACSQSLIYGSQMKQTCIDSKSVDIVLENEITGASQ